MTRTGCRPCHEVAAELAFGIAVGDERAAALDHLSGCRTCRSELRGLVATSDLLLSAAPTLEPPPGFEDRAVAALAPGAPVAPVAPRRRPRSRVAFVAAAVVLALAVSIGTLAVVRGGTGAVGSSGQVATGTVAGRSDRLQAPLETGDGAAVGTVAVTAVSSDRPAPYGTSELVVTLGPDAPTGAFRVECDVTSGRSYTAGELRTHGDGSQRWSTTVGVAPSDLVRVRLVGSDGEGVGDTRRTDLTAELSS